jgi:very-short-patch-repair endonuclease
MPPLPYNPRLKVLARELRNKSTLAEVLLWKHLKSGQRLGCDFHRQKPILEWIADFYSPELQLVIEIDGETHRFRVEEDREKQAAFESLGLTVLRFGDREVKDNALGVAAAIDSWIRNRISDPPRPRTPPCGHPSPEGTQSATSSAKSPLERGGAQRPGVSVVTAELPISPITKADHE